MFSSEGLPGAQSWGRSGRMIHELGAAARPLPSFPFVFRPGP